MDDDWDLHAVVRRFAAAVAANTVPTSNGTAAASNNQQHFPSFPSNLPHHNDPNSFLFSGLVDGRNDHFQVGQGIYDYQQLYVGDPPPVIATSVIPVPPPLVLPPHQYVMQVGPPLRLNMQIQENAQFGISPALGSPSPLQNLPASIPQPINRPRKRKNQQVKMVRIMTQEEITADSWAWRKYGQKPIKGSQHPRNYYRCSTSKGCAARKQVERSSNDPELFVVSYSGEHTHPRPAHRNSLSGTTRSRLASPPARSRRGSRNAVLSQNGSMGSTSTPAAGSSFSPATPSIEGEAAAGNGDVHMAEQGDADDDENAIMIPNDFMNEDDDIFRAFQDTDDHSSGGGSGDFFSSGLLSSPPWTPTSPAGNASSLNGGGA